MCNADRQTDIVSARLYEIKSKHGWTVVLLIADITAVMCSFTVKGEEIYYQLKECYIEKTLFHTVSKLHTIYRVM